MHIDIINSWETFFISFLEHGWFTNASNFGYYNFLSLFQCKSKVHTDTYRYTADALETIAKSYSNWMLIEFAIALWDFVPIYGKNVHIAKIVQFFRTANTAWTLWCCLWTINAHVFYKNGMLFVSLPSIVNIFGLWFFSLFFAISTLFWYTLWSCS